MLKYYFIALSFLCVSSICLSLIFERGFNQVATLQCPGHESIQVTRFVYNDDHSIDYITTDNKEHHKNWSGCGVDEN